MCSNYVLSISFFENAVAKKTHVMPLNQRFEDTFIQQNLWLDQNVAVLNCKLQCILTVQILQNKNQISVLISFLESSITSVYHSVCVWCSVYHLQHSPQRPVCVIGSLFLQWALEGSNFACRDWERGRDSNRKGSREPHTNGCERMVKSLHLQGKAFMALVLLYKGIFLFSQWTRGPNRIYFKVQVVLSSDVCRNACECQEVKCTARQ